MFSKKAVMKFRLIVLFFLTSSFCQNIFANDTSLLYNQRVEEIKKFSAWLENQPNGQVSFTNIDTNSAVWKLYDRAFILFFDKHIMDSLFQTNQQVFAIPAKYQMQKIFLSGYDNLIAAVQRTVSNSKKFLRGATVRVVKPISMANETL